MHSADVPYRPGAPEGTGWARRDAPQTLGSGAMGTELGGWVPFLRAVPRGSRQGTRGAPCPGQDGGLTSRRKHGPERDGSRRTGPPRPAHCSSFS